MSNYFYWVTSEGAANWTVGVEIHVAGITDEKGLSTCGLLHINWKSQSLTYVFEICDFRVHLQLSKRLQF